MKQTKLILTLKHYWQLQGVKPAALSLLVILVVWLIAPYIAFAGRAPFEHLWLRIVVTSIVTLVWIYYGLNYFIQWYKKYKVIRLAERLKIKEKEGRLLNREDKEKLKEYLFNVRQLLRKLNKRWKHPFLFPDKRPWILIAGLSKSGKTTFLENVAFGLSNEDQLNYKGLRIWQNEEVVFFELPNEFFETESALLLQARWRGLLALMRRYHGEEFVNGLLFVIDLPCFSQNKREEWLQLVVNFERQLVLLKTYQYPVPVTVVVSKCDLMRGFTEFFADLSFEERVQSLGFDFTEEREEYLIHDQFVEQFREFMKRMSDRLMWRMHHERNMSARARMKDFLLQLESVGIALENIVAQVSWDDFVLLGGIYFISSLQKSDAEDVSLTSSFAQGLKTAIKKVQKRHAFESKPFFLNALLKRVISPAYFQYHRGIKKFSERLFIFPLILLVIISLIFVWHYAYRKSLTDLRVIQTALKSEHATQIALHQSWQDRLNILYQTYQEIKNQPANKYRWIGLNGLSRIATESRLSYEGLLNNSFVPYLKQDIENQMKTDMGAKNIRLYSDLKTYLMLSDPKRLDINFVDSWFSDLWLQEYPGRFMIQNNLKNHLDYFLHSKLLPLQLDRRLVSKARTLLRTYPLSQISFVVLQDKYHKPLVYLLPKAQTIGGLELNKITIPAFYDPTNFREIYNQDIPDLAKNDITGNWVTGPLPALQLEGNQANILVNQVRELYLRSYAQHWLNLLNNISFSKPKNLNDVQKTLGLLRDPNSPFWQFIHIILGNAMLNGNVQTLGSNLSNLYNNLSKLVNHNDAYNNLQTLLSNFSAYISNITDSPNPDQAAYQVAVDRMQKKSSSTDMLKELNKASASLPMPLQAVLNNLSHDTWQLILHRTSLYLDKQWKTTILKQYQKEIENRYPLFKNADQAVSLKTFAQFFGPNGSIDGFYMYYVNPFVDTSHAYWTWKKIDGLSLDIPQSALDMFIRASLIQKMFFAEDSQTILTHFTLTPINLSQGINQCMLDIDGQEMAFTPELMQSEDFQWPGPKSGLAAVNLATEHDGTFTLNQTGTWAWFKLLDEADLQTTKDPKEYILIFKQDQYHAEFKLSASTLVNPYLPNILRVFRCPKSLLVPNAAND